MSGIPDHKQGNRRITRIRRQHTDYGTGNIYGILEYSDSSCDRLFPGSCFSGVMLVRKKYTGKSSFPFVPFLTAAYVGGVFV